tara:strand:+ start:6731 stop:7987 length:1257 start_codon:yes stop_codon:yes gene_type:complete
MAVDIGKSIISQVSNRTFRKLANTAGSAIRGIPDMLQNSSDAGKVTVELGPFSTGNYQFPLDVESGVEVGNHGHYIMFYINQQENAKLSMSEPEDREGKARTSTIEQRNKQKNIKSYSNTAVIPEFEGQPATTIQYNENIFIDENNYDEKIKELESSASLIKNADGRELEYGAIQNRKYKTASVVRAPTRRLKTAIAMYMPPNIQTTYGAQYTDTEIGTFTESAFDIYDAFVARRYEDAAQSFVQGIEGAEQLLLKGLLGAAGALPGLGGIAELEAFREGRIFSNRMELAFKGVTKRQFQYAFKMIPKSQREAEEIKKIVTAFKYNMLPEFKGDSNMGRQLIVPNTFDIEYMYNGQHNSYIHKISTCFLENMTVNYGGDRYTTHDYDGESGAPPTETTMTLNFREIETMSRERIAEGY